MKALFSAFIAGLIFACGLGLAGMTDPNKVLAFLDVSGAWDPSLALVMAGAILVFALGYRLVIQHRQSPKFGPKFHLAPQTAITVNLVSGAALFGVGWGMAGYCPGPALVSLVSGSVQAWVFVAAMAAGMALFTRFVAK